MYMPAGGIGGGGIGGGGGNALATGAGGNAAGAGLGGSGARPSSRFNASDPASGGAAGLGFP